MNYVCNRMNETYHTVSGTFVLSTHINPIYWALRHSKQMSGSKKASWLNLLLVQLAREIIIPVRVKNHEHNSICGCWSIGIKYQSTIMRNFLTAYAS